MIPPYSFVVPFDGTEEERRANAATHTVSDETVRCTTCGCRPWSRLIEYPCGAEVEADPYDPAYVSEWWARAAVYFLGDDPWTWRERLPLVHTRR